MIGTPRSHGLSLYPKIGTVQKWGRVASKSALSQGGIRKKPRQSACSDASSRPYHVSFGPTAGTGTCFVLARRNETANTRRCLADARRRSTSTVPAPQQFATRTDCVSIEEGGQRTARGMNCLRPVAFLILLAASTGTGVVAADFIVGAMDRWRRHRFFPTV